MLWLGEWTQPLKNPDPCLKKNIWLLNIINCGMTMILIRSHLDHKLNALLKLCKAFLNSQQTLQSICLWVLKKMAIGLFYSTFSIGSRSLSRTGLMICKWRPNFPTMFSKAFSRITFSKSRFCCKRFSLHFKKYNLRAASKQGHELLHSFIMRSGSIVTNKVEIANTSFTI